MLFKAELVLSVNDANYKQTVVLPFVPFHGMEISVEGCSSGFEHIVEHVCLDVKNEKLTVFFEHEKHDEFGDDEESILINNGWVRD